MRKHLRWDVPLREKALELIANSRYGIYDLSYRRDDKGEWHMPSNVFIELGMAIALNRPVFMLRHACNRELELAECLRGLGGRIFEFSGETTLKRTLSERLPEWINVTPEQGWWNRYCLFGGRKCTYREAHPSALEWGKASLRCCVIDGADVDRFDFRSVVEEVFGLYGDVALDYLDSPSTAEGYDFAMCTLCQTARSKPLAVYRITSQSLPDGFIMLGMSVALEAQFAYKIPRVIMAERAIDIPSLLSGYEIITARSDRERRNSLRQFVPAVIHAAHRTLWKPRPLPFVEDLPQPGQVSGYPRTPIWTWVTDLPEDYNQLLERILSDAVKLVAAEAAGTILMFDPETDELVVEAGRSAPSGESLRLSLGGQGVTAQVARSRKSMLIADVLTSSEYLQLTADTRSKLAVPLVWENRLLGVLNLESPYVGAFSAEDETRVEQLAAHAAQAMIAARSRQARGSQQLWLERIEAARSTAKTSGEVVELIAQALISTLGADAAVIYLLAGRSKNDLGSGSWAHSGLVRPEVLETPQLGELTSRVLSEGLVVIENAADDSDAVPKTPFLQREGIRSFAGVALRDGADNLGVMFIHYRTPHVFKVRELEWIRTLAAIAGSIIKDAQQPTEQDTSATRIDNASISEVASDSGLTSPYCFVIMPFASEFMPIFDSIRAAIERSTTYHCLRADSVPSVEPLQQKVRRLIDDSVLVIADVSGQNPNVFMELGLATARGKPIVAISRDPGVLNSLQSAAQVIYDPSNLQDLETRLAVAARELTAEAQTGHDATAQQTSSLASQNDARGDDKSGGSSIEVILIIIRRTCAEPQLAPA